MDGNSCSRARFDTHHILPRGTLDQAREQVRRRIEQLALDGGASSARDTTSKPISRQRISSPRVRPFLSTVVTATRLTLAQNGTEGSCVRKRMAWSRREDGIRVCGTDVRLLWGDSYRTMMRIHFSNVRIEEVRAWLGSWLF